MQNGFKISLSVSGFQLGLPQCFAMAFIHRTFFVVIISGICTLIDSNPMTCGSGLNSPGCKYTFLRFLSTYFLNHKSFTTMDELGLEKPTIISKSIPIRASSRTSRSIKFCFIPSIRVSIFSCSLCTVKRLFISKDN